MHPKKFLFGAAAPFVCAFLKTTLVRTITVNGERYRAMVTYFFVAQVKRYGHRLHLVPAGRRYVPHDFTIDILHELFESVVVSRSREVMWPH